MDRSGETVFDDRGATRTVIRPGKLVLRVLPPPEPFTRAQRRALRSALGPHAGLSRDARRLGGLALIVASALFIWSNDLGGRWGRIVSIAMLLGALVRAAYLLLRAPDFSRVRPHTLARELLAIGRCPTGAYSLVEIPPDPDGCTTCPECSAAWRLPTPADGA